MPPQVQDDDIDAFMQKRKAATPKLPSAPKPAPVAGDDVDSFMSRRTGSVSAPMTKKAQQAQRREQLRQSVTSLQDELVARTPQPQVPRFQSPIDMRLSAPNEAQKAFDRAAAAVQPAPQSKPRNAFQAPRPKPMLERVMAQQAIERQQPQTVETDPQRLEQLKQATGRQLAEQRDVRMQQARSAYGELSPVARMGARALAKVGGATDADMAATMPASRMESVPGQFAQGAITTTARIPEGLERLGQSLPNPFDPFGANANLREAQRKAGQNTLLTSGITRKGDALADVVAPVDKADQSFLTAKLPRGLGSSVPFIASSALGGGMPAAAAMGAAINAQQTGEDLDRMGVQDENTRRKATAVAGLIGTLEALGIEGRLGKVFSGGITKRLLGAGGEGLQEWTTEELNDINAKLIAAYDPNRSINPLQRKQLEAAALGALTGGLFEAGGKLAQMQGDAQIASQQRAIRSAVDQRSAANAAAIAPQPAAAQPVTEPLTEPMAAQPQPSAPATPQAQPQGFPRLPEPQGVNIRQAKILDMPLPIEVTLNEQIQAAAQLLNSTNEGDQRQGRRMLNKALTDLRKAEGYLAEAALPPDAPRPFTAVRDAIEARLKPAPKAPKGLNPEVQKSVDLAKQDAVEAEQAGNYEAAANHWKAAHSSLVAAQREIRRSGNAEQIKAIATDISIADANRRKAMQAARTAQRQANAPTAGLSQSQANQVKTDANNSRNAQSEANPPLLRPDAVQNPEGGIPQMPEPSFTDRLESAARRDASARGKAKPAKRLLSRIAELGGISDRYAGELQDVKDARRIGVIRQKAEMSPDVLARQLQSEGYDVDPEDLNTLWEAARRDVAGRDERTSQTSELERRLTEEEAVYNERQPFDEIVADVDAEPTNRLRDAEYEGGEVQRYSKPLKGQAVEREAFQPDTADLREVREFGKREPRTEQFTEEPPTAPLARRRATPQEENLESEASPTMPLVPPLELTGKAKQQADEIVDIIWDLQRDTAGLDATQPVITKHKNAWRYLNDAEGNSDTAIAEFPSFLRELKRLSQSPATPLARRRQPIRPPAPASPRPVGNRPLSVDVAGTRTPTAMSPDFPRARREMAKQGREVEARLTEGQDKGEFGNVAEAMFKSNTPDVLHGQDSFFHDPDLKGKLGLTREAEMADVRRELKTQLARSLGLSADEVSLSHIKPEVWRAWAKQKGLGREAVRKLEAGIARAERKQRATETNAQIVAEESQRAQSEVRQPAAKAGKSIDAQIKDIRDLQKFDLIDDKEAKRKIAALEAQRPKIAERREAQPRTREDVENSPEFKRWFGDSKVVDENGKPLVVYHGTQSPNPITSVDFSKLDPNALFGPGFYTTQDPAIAAGEGGYALTKRPNQKSSDAPAPHAYPLYLSIQKPFKIDGWHNPEKFLPALGDTSFKKFEVMSGADIYQRLTKLTGSKKKANEYLKSLGFDGITHPGGNRRARSGTRSFADEGAAKQYAGRIGGEVETSPYTGNVSDALIEEIGALWRLLPYDVRGEFWQSLKEQAKTNPDVQPAISMLRDIQSGSVKGVSVPGVIELGLQFLENPQTENLLAGDFAEQLTLLNDGLEGRVSSIHTVLGHRVWIAFYPEQVKSAIGNRGTFDPDSAKITERRSEAMPERYTGRQLFENAQLTFRPARNRPATLVANDWGGAMLNQLLNDTFGITTTDANFTIAAKDAKDLRDYLAEAKDSGIYEPAQVANMDAMLKQMDAAIADAEANQQDVAFVTRRPAEPISATKAKIRHETAHISQSRIAADLSALTGKNWLDSQPNAADIHKELDRRGYAPETHDYEAAAFVASGDYGVFGMNLDQAAKFLSDYFGAVVEKHGKRALQKFGAIDPRLQPVLEAQRETGTTRSSTDGRTNETAPGTPRRIGAAGEARGSSAGVRTERRERRERVAGSGFSFGRVPEGQGQVLASGFNVQGLFGRAPKEAKDGKPTPLPKDFDLAKWSQKSYADAIANTLPAEVRAEYDKAETQKEKFAVLMSAPVDAAVEAKVFQLIDKATLAAEKDDGRAVMEAVRDMREYSQSPATNWEKANALRKAFMLSRPVTHLRNIIGNTAFQPIEEAARIPGSLADSAIGLMTGRRTLKGANPLEVAKATYTAATDGVRRAKDAMKGLDLDKLEDALQVREIKFNNKLVDKTVKAIFRSLSAEDQIFFTYAYDRALREQAKLTALNERKAGVISGLQATRERADYLHKNPTDQMDVDALAAAEVAVFRNNNKLSDALRSARESLGDKGTFALDLFLPFDRTPTNLVLRALEYTPAGGLLAAGKGVMATGRGVKSFAKSRKELPTRQAIKKAIDEALTPQQQRDIAQLLGRSTTGTGGLITLGYTLAAAGLMTGFYDEEDRNANKKQMELGARPSSIKIGGRWYQVGGIPPLGTLLALGATLHKDLKDERDPEEIVSSAAAGMGKVALGLPQLEAVKGLSEAVTKEGRAGQKVGRIASSFVPGLLSDFGQVVPGLRDPYERETRGDKKLKPLTRFARDVGGEVAGRIPGVRKMLPEKKTPLGRPIPTEWSDVIDPFNSRPAETSADIGGMKGERLRFGTLGSEIRQKVGEPEAIYKQRVERVEGWMSEYGDKLLSHPSYTLLTESQKQAAMESLRRRISNQQNKREPKRDLFGNIESLAPEKVIQSVLKSEATRPKREAGKLWSPPANRP